MASTYASRFVASWLDSFRFFSPKTILMFLGLTLKTWSNAVVEFIRVMWWAVAAFYGVLVYLGPDAMGTFSPPNLLFYGTAELLAFSFICALRPSVGRKDWRYFASKSVPVGLMVVIGAGMWAYGVYRGGGDTYFMPALFDAFFIMVTCFLLDARIVGVMGLIKQYFKAVWNSIIFIAFNAPLYAVVALLLYADYQLPKIVTMGGYTPMMNTFLFFPLYSTVKFLVPYFLIITFWENVYVKRVHEQASIFYA